MSEMRTTGSKSEPFSGWRDSLAQSMSLLLSFVILGGLTLLYIGLFHGQLNAYPGMFEWTSVVNTAVPTVLVAVGQTIVVITRGIDLSVGGVIDLSNALAATQMKDSIANMVGWSIAILALGAACGALNGILIAYGRLQPILVTLATLAILQGLAIWILPEPGGLIPPSYSNTLANAQGPWSLIFIGLVAAAWLGLRRVTIGVRIFAIGNDESAARAHGIPVRRVKVIAYALSGLLAAASGLFISASTTGGDAAAGDVYVLTSIAAVVLGGISFHGGRGSALGSFQGLFLVLAVFLGVILGRLLKAST